MHSWLEVPANYRCNSVLAVARLGGQAVRLMLEPKPAVAPGGKNRFCGAVLVSSLHGMTVSHSPGHVLAPDHDGS